VAYEQPWSTMVMMESFLFDWGSSMIRSIAIYENGFMSGVIVMPKSGVFFL
jgi:hypothetical protein